MERLPWLWQRGDLTKDSAEDLARAIEEVDPYGEAIVIVAMAPPRQDFSLIRAEGPEHKGKNGGLFLQATGFVDDLRRRLPRRKFGSLAENTTMRKEDAQIVTDELDCQPILVCASDFGWISRPRLFWMSIDWSDVRQDPAPGAHLVWSVQDGWDRLRLEATRPSVGGFDLAGLKFHPTVASGRRCMPCSTAPAPDENGRAAPRNQRGSVPPDAKDRWLADKRQFAPWRYVRKALIEDEAGQVVVPPPDVKEHPKGFTDVRGVDTRTRHRLVGNGWRWGVATRLLCMLVARTFAAPTDASPTLLATPRRSTIDFVAGILRPGLSMACRPLPAPAGAPLQGVDPSSSGLQPPDHGALRPGAGLGVLAGGPDPAPARHPPHPCGRKSNISSRTARKTLRSAKAGGHQTDVRHARQTTPTWTASPTTSPTASTWWARCVRARGGANAPIAVTTTQSTSTRCAAGTDSMCAAGC